MKVTCTVIVLLATLFSVFAFPSPASNSKKDVEDDVELIPGRRNPFDPTIVDTGSVPGGFPGSFGDFDSIFTRMRQQLDQLLRAFGGGSAPGFPNVQSGFPHIPDLDLGKGNTTSVTKVIDGHKVVINETEYNKQGDFGGAFFKVRIIDVKPDSSESTTQTVSAESDDNSTREVAENNSAENEVTKNEALEGNDLNMDITSNDIETFGDDLDIQPQPLGIQDYSELELGETEPLDQVDNFGNRELSNDIDVNQYLADQGAPTNPDAEVFFEPQNTNKHYFGKQTIPR